MASSFSGLVYSDFCLTVYSVQVSDVPDLQQRMQNGFDIIHTRTGIFSESGNHGSDVQIPALRFKVDTLRIFFKYSDDRKSETMLRKAYVRKTLQGVVIKHR